MLYLLYIIILYFPSLIVLGLLTAVSFKIKFIGLVQIMFQSIIIIVVAFPVTFIGVASGSIFLAALLIAAIEEVIRGLMAIRMNPSRSFISQVVLMSVPFAFAETSNWPAGEKAQVAMAELQFDPIWYVLLDIGYIFGEFGFGILINVLFASLWLIILRGKAERYPVAFLLPFALHFALDYFAIQSTS